MIRKLNITFGLTFLVTWIWIGLEGRGEPHGFDYVLLSFNVISVVWFVLRGACLLADDFLKK